MARFDPIPSSHGSTGPINTAEVTMFEGIQAGIQAAKDAVQTEGSADQLCSWHESAG